MEDDSPDERRAARGDAIEADPGHTPIGAAPTGPVRGERDRDATDLPEEARPTGAIMVTAVTAVTILVMFFGVLALLMARN